MIKLKVQSSEFATHDGKTKDGRPYQMRTQFAWLDMTNGERRKVRIRLDRDQLPYTPGEYTLHDDSFVVGEYGDLGMAFSPKLEKLVAAK